ARATANPVGTLPTGSSPFWRSTSNREEEWRTMSIRSLSIAACSWALAGLMTAMLTPSVTAADPPPLERVQTIALKGPAGGLDHLAVDTKRGRLFVANTVNGTLDIVDLRAGKLLKQVPGQGRIRGIDSSPEVDRVFVGNGTGGVCNTFDGDTYELVKSVPLGDDADNVRYNPRTRRIYVVHADAELSVIDAGDYTLRSPIALPKGLGAF